MLAPLLAALLFSISAVCGYRSAKQIGGVEANFWRICVAVFCLALWAHLFGSGVAGTAFPWFLASGFFGIGLGDTGYFQALPRIGARRAVLLVQCFIPLFAILIERFWLGTKLAGAELLFIGVILVGVAVALAPRDHAKIAARQLWIGISFTAFAGLCSAYGAVLSRKAYFVAHQAGEFPDPGTTGYQRVLGGILIPAIILLLAKWRSAYAHGGLFEEKTFQVSREKWRRIWPWVLGNSFSGQVLGVTCVQWALEKIPTGIVMAVVATTPIVLLPMTRIIDGERIGIRSLLGVTVAVAGVIGLTLVR